MLIDYIVIKLNGRPFNCVSNLSLQNLLVYLNFDLSLVIVEYNDEIVHSSSFSKINVMSGDKIEVLTMVGGG